MYPNDYSDKKAKKQFLKLLSKKSYAEIIGLGSDREREIVFAVEPAMKYLPRELGGFGVKEEPLEKRLLFRHWMNFRQENWDFLMEAPDDLTIKEMRERAEENVQKTIMKLKKMPFFPSVFPSRKNIPAIALL